MHLNSCTIDLAAREVVRDDGGPRLLRPREAELLAYLVARAGRDVSRQELVRAVWGQRSRTSRALDVCVRRLRTLIEHDPGSPDHLRTVRGVGYRLDLPESTATTPRPNVTLPLRLDRFVGREPELRALAPDAGAPRWQLLVGTVGVGKSRIALEHARQLLPSFAGQVWWCELAGARTMREVTAAVARVVGSDARDPSSLSEILVAAGPALLVLDDLDGVFRPGAILVEHWLSQAPELHILGTSRRSLGLAGEVTHSVAPLLAQEAAVLFADRAAAGTEVRADDPRVVDIVSQVQGVPLAVELAASRVRGLSLDELSTRLRASVVELQSLRHRPERHSSLRRAIEASWRRLDESEQLALAQLSVFPGGFTEADAATVLPADRLRALSTLLAHHLVRCVDENPPRFELWTMIRQFAAGCSPPEV